MFYYWGRFPETGQLTKTAHWINKKTLKSFQQSNISMNSIVCFNFQILIPQIWRNFSLQTNSLLSDSVKSLFFVESALEPVMIYFTRTCASQHFRYIYLSTQQKIFKPSCMEVFLCRWGDFSSKSEQKWGKKNIRFGSI